MMNHARLKQATCLFAASLALALPVRAQDASTEPDRSWTLQVENDLFSQFMGLADSDSDAPDFDGDRGYTQGLRLGLTLKREEDLFFIFDWIDDNGLSILGGGEGDTSVRTKQYFFGQNIYTPKDITVSTPQPDDRPYAAWLYAGGSVARQTGRSFEVIELDVGVMGPMALGKEVQTAWHDIVNTRHPEGWRNQLRNEPGFVMTYMIASQLVRHDAGGEANGFGFDITPHGSIAIGTIYDYVSVGGTARIGWGRDREIVTPNRIQPSTPGSDWFSPGSFTGYFFVGAEGRFMARNAFLDGNLFRDSQSVDKHHWVADIVAGAVMFAGDWRLAYTHTFRTEEFHGQEGGQFFGAVSVTKLF